MLLEYLTHCGFVVHEGLNRLSGLGHAARMEPLSLADAIAADVAFDDAIAAAIEREAGKSHS
jgi:hypothetical protein